MIDLTNLLLNQYGIFVFFIAVLVSSYFPIPVIGYLIVSFGASMKSSSDLIFAIIVLYCAMLIGDLTVYLVAKHFSKRVMKFLKRFAWFKHGEKRTRPLFQKYEFPIVFVSRFLNTELCVVVNYICGFEKYDYKKFALAVLLGELIYIAGYMTFGYMFKETWMVVGETIKYYVLRILLLVVGIYILYKIFRYIQRKWKEKH